MPSESPLLLKVKCSKGRKWSDFYYLQNAIAKGCGHHHQELRKCLSDEVATEVWLLAQAQKATHSGARESSLRSTKKAQSSVSSYVVSSKGLSRRGTNRWREYLICNKSPTSSISFNAVSSISLVWDADRQNLALDSMMGVAGNPTTTTPMLRFSNSRPKAPIFAGMYSIKGTTGESSFP